MEKILIVDDEAFIRETSNASWQKMVIDPYQQNLLKMPLEL